jgi:hypothetical protein
METNSPTGGNADIGEMIVGRATLTVESVESHCALGRNGEHTSLIGHDVLFELAFTGSNKGEKGFAFCPARAADGGTMTPRLQTWQNCSAYPSCHVISVDAGFLGRAELQCGKDHIVLEVKNGRTVLTGPLGERELWPHPMRIAPVKRTTRRAAVDC